jgi:poly-gamma-glutamate synthesis protein (capsule biosynthesis protein)
VGNFVMKETDNANQRRGWVLRLLLDKQGVVGLDTRVANISMDRIPSLDSAASSPCWQRGQAAVQMCPSSK